MARIEEEKYAEEDEVGLGAVEILRLEFDESLESSDTLIRLTKASKFVNCCA